MAASSLLLKPVDHSLAPGLSRCKDGSAASLLNLAFNGYLSKWTNGASSFSGCLSE